MKKTITTYIICLWLGSVFGQTTFSIEGGNVNVDKSVSIVLENTTWQNDGSFAADSGTVFFVDGNIITGLSPTTFYILKVDNTNNDLDIFQYTSVRHQLELVNGKIQLNAFPLELMEGASFIGADENKYIQINANGPLIQTIGNTPLLFPIGAATFNPAYVSNNTTNSRIGLLVRDVPAAKSVNRVWELDNWDGSVIDAEISLLWDNQLTDINFDATQSSIIDLNNNNVFTPVFTPAQMSSVFPTFTEQTRDSITQSSTFTVRSDLSISVEEVLSESSISIFPNPASHYLKIQSEDLINETVQIFNVTGQLVKEFQHQSQIINLPITNLPNGTYFIKMDNQIKKVVVVK